jgi:membrane-bound lytic murein transglycosylase A
LRRDLLAVLALALCAVAGCSASREAGPSSPWKEVDLANVFDDLEPASLVMAAERTATALAAKPPAPVVLGDRRYETGDLVESAGRVARIARESDGDRSRLSSRLARECRAFASPQPAKVTAYYEPLLEARRRADPRFRYPLYAAPSKAQFEAVTRKLGHAPTRADIDGGHALRGLGLEIAWVADPVARFFLHVQGSGRLVFADGREARVGYAGNNGLAYRSIGAHMLAEGLLKPGKASAPAMRAWLAAFPDRRDSLLFFNPRYIFFRDTGGEGPIGALGATLVPGRSIATDARFVPLGILGLLRTTQPIVDREGQLRGERPLERFVFAQDAGAAIEGQARVDLFWGSGEEAGTVAGTMNQAGELFLLVCERRAPPSMRLDSVPRHRTRFLPGLRSGTGR